MNFETRFRKLASDAETDPSSYNLGRAGALRNLAEACQRASSEKGQADVVRKLATTGVVAPDHDASGRPIWGGELGTEAHLRWVSYRDGVRAGYLQALEML